jgi:hypothetical protein
MPSFLAIRAIPLSFKKKRHRQRYKHSQLKIVDMAQMGQEDTKTRGGLTWQMSPAVGQHMWSEQVEVAVCITRDLALSIRDKLPLQLSNPDLLRDDK